MSLQVQINSFSYKKGIPVDASGNGGGFVFDCRGIENPGRQDAYKKLSGLDQPVIDFLENSTKMPDFIVHINDILALTIENYIERGFTHLQVNFGCTGGQHRSVYASEKTKEILQKLYPEVVFVITHTNSKNWVQ
jgi:RNase adaptor protein for sRNA GlmZ degradation